MAVLADRLAREYPDANRDHGVRVYTLTRGMLDEGTGPLLSLWQASAFVVLLIACANIANLMLARAAERRRETAVRLALGAGRGRVIRELLTESTLLALIAVPPALGFAWVALRAIRVSMPANILRFVPGFESLGPDLRLLGVTVGLAVLTACIFGLLPALHASRTQVSEALKEGGRSSTGRQTPPPRHRRRRNLDRAAAARGGRARRPRHQPLPQRTAGLRPRRRPDDEAGAAGADVPRRPPQRRFVERAIDAVAAVPGVEHAAVVNNPPASGSNLLADDRDRRHPAPDPKNPPVVDNRVGDGRLLTVMRIPIRAGRAFSSADRDGTAPVVIVSESMAKKYWPGEDPLGRRLKRSATGPWVTVVGVCGDIIQDWFNRRNDPTMYRPLSQAPSDYFGIVVRTAGDPPTARRRRPPGAAAGGRGAAGVRDDDDAAVAP